ncbi:cyclic AMP-responsive element-binding protein 3-like protein 1 isoform X3 [Silurus meridionalis]|nr:cyclic AMP-responsive element-binding protein 3-like protein 1 isoform X3 [Silurus meridionalis]
MDGSGARMAVKASGTGGRERTLNQPGVSVSMTTAAAVESNGGVYGVGVWVCPVLSRKYLLKSTDSSFQDPKFRREQLLRWKEERRVSCQDSSCSRGCEEQQSLCLMAGHFSEQMEDFSNELFNSFFDDHLLAERTPLLDMELEPPNPDIQQEHSYSLSGDSAPQSPSMPIKSDDDTALKKFPLQVLLPYVAFILMISLSVSLGTEGMWAFSQDLTAILVKQEPTLLSETSPGPSPAMPTSSSSTQPITLNPPPQRRHTHDKAFTSVNSRPE